MNTVNELNVVIDEYKHSYNEIDKENSSLKYQLKLKDEEIDKSKEEFERMDNQLKKLDSSYIMTFSGIYNNKLIMIITARITEYSKEEQNKVAMYLVKSI